MPTIRFVKARPAVEAPTGVSLMQALKDAGVTVASSCRGDGICRKCRLKIVAGAAHLSPPTDLEKRWAEQDEPEKDTRLSCQAVVQGDVTVDATYW